MNIREGQAPQLDAKLVAQSIAEQLGNRVAFRRAMGWALTSAMRSAPGVKVKFSGRLGWRRMYTGVTRTAACRSTPARRRDCWLRRGEDRHRAHRRPECWINKGEVMPEGFESSRTSDEAPMSDRPDHPRRPWRRRREAVADGDAKRVSTARSCGAAER